MSGRKNEGLGDRGASEIIGVVLLFGLVAAGVGIVLITGGALQDDISEQQKLESAEDSMKQLDAGMGSMTSENTDSPAQEFVVTDRGAETVAIEHGDTLSISVASEADSSACTATVPLDAIRYDLEGENSVVYQAGGVWKSTQSGLSVASPPDISFREGSVDLSVAELRGRVDNDFTARKNVSASQEMSADVTETLFEGADECRRPDGLTITIDSEQYHEVWYRYFTEEMPTEHDEVSVSHDPDAGTVTLELDQKALPEESDDRRNTVVDFDGPDWMGEIEDGEFGIDKPDDDDNEYTASMTYLGSQAGKENETSRTVVVQPRDEHEHDAKYKPINETRLVRNTSKKKTGEPLDLLFVLDESGSMTGPCDYRDDHCRRTTDTRLDKVKDATKYFLGKVKRARGNHKAGVSGYSSRHAEGAGDVSQLEIYQEVSPNIPAATRHVDDLSPGGMTPIGEAIDEACDHLVVKNGGWWLPGSGCGHAYTNSPEDRDSVVILLSDGKNNVVHWGRDPVGRAEAAAKNDITIHTVSVGTDRNRDLLKEVAGTTGGEYHYVADASDLDDAFEDILVEEIPEYSFENVTVGREKVNKSWTHVHQERKTEKRYSRRIVHTPVTLSVEIGDEERRPWKDGDDVLDRALNPPYFDGEATPDGITIEDGQSIDFDAAVYDCDSQVKYDEEDDPDGDTWNHTKCSAVGDELDHAEDMVAFTDGADVPDSDAPWWQDNLTEVVPDSHLNDTDGDGEAEQFDLASNQAVVVFKFADNDGAQTDYNNAVFLFEVGKPTETKTEWMLNLQVNVVENEDS